MNVRRTQQLGSLLLAIVVLAAVVWGVQIWSWVRDRRELISEKRADSPYELRVTEGGQAPAGLSWFGERGYERIELEFQNRPPEYQLTDTQRPLLERYRRLFPEAQVVVVPEATAPPSVPRVR